MMRLSRPGLGVLVLGLLAMGVVVWPGGPGQDATRGHDHEVGSLERKLERLREEGGTGVAGVGSFTTPEHGGRGVAHYAGGIRAPGSLQDRAPDGVVYDTGTLAWEPTLGVNGRGHLFYVGADIGFGFARWPVVTSRDGGRTWEEISPRVGSQAVHFMGLDPMLYVDPYTGRVFASDLQADMCALVSFTDDEGDTWTTSKACGLTDHQNIFAGPPSLSPTVGYSNVVYYCAADGGATAQPSTATSCLKSLDGGLTWVRTGAPAFTDDPRHSDGQIVDGHCAGGTGHGHIGLDGVVYLPRGWCGQPYLGISHDEGATWTRVQVARNGMPVRGSLQEHEAGVVVDRLDNIYYFWMGADRLPYLSISRDGGTSWSQPMMIGIPGLVESWGPTIAIGGPGKIAVAYVGTTDSFHWNGYITMTDNVLASKPVFYSGRVHAAEDSLLRGHCGVVRCGLQGDFIDVVIGPGGVPYASFVAGCWDRVESFCGDGSEDGKPFGLGLVGKLVGGPSLR